MMTEFFAQLGQISQHIRVFWLCLCLAAPMAQAESARGLDNPTLALNLSPPRDWAPGLQFLDLIKLARPFIAVSTVKGTRNLDYETLRAQGYLDAQGWPQRLPEGYQAFQSMWQWRLSPEQSAYLKGRYRLRYDGTGALYVSGKGVSVISQAPGEIWFDMDGSQTVFLHITETDPNATGDHIRNITLVAERHLDLYALGAVFNPDWRSLVEDARQIRFMDWGDTNNSNVETWSDRAVRGGAPRFDVPLEDMVQLANEIGAAPWFTMPHRADEAYLRAFATYVRDNVDPRLPIRVEYSNEIWNWKFKQSKWLAEESVNAWGRDTHIDYHVKKAVETARIWNEVFGDAAPTRLVHVLGAHATNVSRTETMLDVREWRRRDRDGFTRPRDVFDELAIAHYFGGYSMRDGPTQVELLQAITDPGINATTFLARRLIDPDFRLSLPFVADAWREQARLAQRAGLRLVAYEGGQHVHHRGQVKDLSEEEQARLTGFLVQFIRSVEMAELYAESWRLWAEISDGPFMQFGDIRRPNKFGSWSMYESLLETTARADVLVGLNETQSPWWNTAPNPAFLQGITTMGSAGADDMSGTAEEDYLMAGAGDDVIEETAGNDGVHGGPGHDTILLSARSDAYVFRAEPGRIVVEGPQGRDIYVSIEDALFSDGTRVRLADLVQP